MENYLSHIGVGHLDDPPGRGSGRYGWGSGEKPFQHQNTFKMQVEQLLKSGMTKDQVAKYLLGEHSKAKDLDTKISLEEHRTRDLNVTRAWDLYYGAAKGNVSEVGRMMGINESSVRKLMEKEIAEKQNQYLNTAEFLKDRIAKSKSGIIDVGKDTELTMGVTTNTKMLAIRELEEQGYTYTFVQIPRPGSKNMVNTKVLASPELTWKEIQQNKYNVEGIFDYSPDGGKTFKVVNDPVSLDSKRVYIRYAEDGGVDKDGVVELRRNVKDLSLNGASYSQVRVMVDGKYYMKGMAVYGDDIPDGYDVVYNTNKKTGTDKNSVFKGCKVAISAGELANLLGMSKTDVQKQIKDGILKVDTTSDLEKLGIKNVEQYIDKDNPFGALIKPITAGGQYNYTDSNGKEKQSPINKVSNEGDWDDWSRKLASQFMSKQDIQLIRRQIDLTTIKKESELDQIRALTNPVIKQKLLEDYASQCDSDAIRLKTVGFKGSAFQVLLPVVSLKDNEIYAPNYNNGEQVALIRYPHAGPFEIVVGTVNNNNKEGQRVITMNGADAIGINKNNADKLSGADFDGDTAVVIPLTSNNIKIKYSEKLPQLENFDPKIYKQPDSAPQVKNSTKQREMGIVTNLITDMSASSGVSMDEIARAVKVSMVVIDSEKHHLDWKKAKEDNNIQGLINKYQLNEETGKAGGASTIFSRASSEVYINKRKETNDLSKMTPEEQTAWKAGKKIYREDTKEVMDGVKITDPSKMTEKELQIYNAGKTVWRDTGKTKKVQEQVSQMSIVDDAMDLVRDKSNPKEVAYANYANKLKSLANEARAEARAMTFEKASPSAKETYADQVESLNTKLRNAQANNPKERAAVAIANAMVSERFKSREIDWDYEHKQREKARAMEEARAIVGAKKDLIVIEDDEWEAIQAGAIAPTKLKQIIQNTDQDAFKQRATPKDSRTLTAAQIARIKAYAAAGNLTNKQIADALGISASTVSRVINEGS